jgi:predicted Fe-Mo cluster-binding NifX family protein
MIVGIPTDDGKHVSDHFGRSRYILVADTGKPGERNLVENPHQLAETEQGGHGMLLKMLREREVRRVICSNLNPRMQKNLESLGIQVVRCEASAEIESVIRDDGDDASR